MKRTLITAFIFVLALATMAGSRGTAALQSSTPNNRGVDVMDPQKSGDEVREEFHQTYPMSANGRVSLENINGSVRIAVWDQNEVKVDAVKRASRKERLAEAKIEINSTGDSVRIRTEYPDRDQTFTNEEGRRYNNPASVDYSLTIPRQARIDAVELINGSLEIDGATGDVKASSINGRVSAKSLTGDVKLSTVNGSLEATFTQLDAANCRSFNSRLRELLPTVQQIDIDLSRTRMDCGGLGAGPFDTARGRRRRAEAVRRHCPGGACSLR